MSQLIYNDGITRVRADLPSQDSQHSTSGGSNCDPFRKWDDAAGAPVLPSLTDWRDAEREAREGNSLPLHFLKKMYS